MNHLNSIVTRQRKSRMHDYLFSTFVLAIVVLLTAALSACAVDDETTRPYPGDSVDNVIDSSDDGPKGRRIDPDDDQLSDRPPSDWPELRASCTTIDEAFPCTYVCTFGDGSEVAFDACRR